MHKSVLLNQDVLEAMSLIVKDEKREYLKYIRWFPEKKSLVVTDGRSLARYVVSSCVLSEKNAIYRYVKGQGLEEVQLDCKDQFPPDSWETVIPQEKWDKEEKVTEDVLVPKSKEMLLGLVSRISCKYGIYFNGEVFTPIKKLVSKHEGLYGITCYGVNKAVRIDFPGVNFTFVAMPLYKKK